MRLCAVSKIYHSKPNSPYYFSIMPTLELTNKEVNLLNSIFAAIADLDLYEHFDCEDSDSDNAQLFDSLWDKVVKL